MIIIISLLHEADEQNLQHPLPGRHTRETRGAHFMIIVITLLHEVDEQNLQHMLSGWHGGTGGKHMGLISWSWSSAFFVNKIFVTCFLGDTDGKHVKLISWSSSAFFMNKICSTLFLDDTKGKHVELIYVYFMIIFISPRFLINKIFWMLFSDGSQEMCGVHFMLMVITISSSAKTSARFSRMMPRKKSGAYFMISVVVSPSWTKLLAHSLWRMKSGTVEIIYDRLY